MTDDNKPDSVPDVPPAVPPVEPPAVPPVVPPVEPPAAPPVVPPVEPPAAPPFDPPAVAPVVPPVVAPAVSTALAPGAPPPAVIPPAAPMTTPGAPRKGLGTGAIIGIIAGAVALLVIVVVIIATVIPAITRNPAADAQATVEGYFAALAEADAEAALAFLSSPPVEGPLLTDEVLAASNELAAVTDFEVLDSSVANSYGTVLVSYNLGDTPVSAAYELSDLGEGDEAGWLIDSGLNDLRVGDLPQIGVTVNGATVEGDTFQVFPGTYELAVTGERFELTGETTLQSIEPFTSLDASLVEAKLTDAAVQEFRAAVRSAVDACVASTSLTAGCGIDLPPTLSDGTQMTDGTITRSLSADASATIDSMDVTLSYSNPNLAEGEYIGGVSAEGGCTKDGSVGTCSVLFGPSLGRPFVDMAAETLTVTWQ